MGRFTDWLRTNIPRTGRMIKEDGGFYNEADHLQAEEYGNASFASIRGRVYRASYAAELSAGTYYFAQTPPPGTLVRSIAFTASVDGIVRASLNYGGTAGADVQTLDAFNVDARLNSVSAPIREIDGITGGDYLDLGFIKTPSATAQRASSAIVDANVRGTYDADNPALFKIVVDATTDVSFLWIWEEVDES